MAEVIENTIKSNEMVIEYQQSKDLDLKAEMVVKYSYIVKTIAFQIQGAYINGIDIDDIVSEGFYALIGAFDTFDYTKNVKFETYASLRIRGGMIDYLRKQDWTPRRVKKNAKLIESAQSELYRKLGKHPSEEQIAQHLGWDMREYFKNVQEVQHSSILSLNMLVCESETKSIQDDVRSEDIDSSPEASLERTELYNTMYKAVEGLSEREQLVISLYYNKNLKLKEIAYVLNVSEPRVSQIHSSAIRKLKYKMTEYMK